MDNRTISIYALLIWFSVGTIIWLFTIPKLFKLREYKYWWTWAELFHSYVHIAPMSIMFLLFMAYCNYQHKKILEKIKQGKTSAKYLF